MPESTMQKLIAYFHIMANFSKTDNKEKEDETDNKKEKKDKKKDKKDKKDKKKQKGENRYYNFECIFFRHHFN